ERTNATAGRVLDVGVGTGISLKHYRKDHDLYGIDISSHMLEKARQRAARIGRDEKLTHLIEMDAEHLDFPDAWFDSVVACYVMSVVPNPHKALMEIERVCKPGADVIIINHFIAEKGLLRKAEQWLAPFSGRLGWRPDMEISEILGHTRLELVEKQTLPPMGLFTMLHLRKTAG
ncbi:MAG: hypothetical protein RIQ52_1450, partial [Pseudomonadota bacterium]